MKSLDELVVTDDPAIDLIRGWVAASPYRCRLLPPSPRREKVLLGLQVTTRSVLGALAYETGGLTVDHGWLRFLGSGNQELSRDLLSWNEERNNGYFLVADDVVGGFFAINGGALGTDHGAVYYLAPDDLDWLNLEIPFSEFVQSCLTNKLDDFYSNLRWPNWRDDIAPLSGDECFSYFPFLWSKEGSLTTSSRASVPIAEAYNLRIEIGRQLNAHSRDLS